MSTYTKTFDLNMYLDQAVTDGVITYQGIAIATGLILTLLAIIAFLQLFVIIGRWKTIKKLGGEGWSQIVPVYSEWTMSRAAGCTMALCVAVTVLDLITFFQGAITADWFQYIAGACTIAFIVVRCVYLYKVCQGFGKDGVGFALGLVILPFIFWMILGCGSAQPVDEK